MSDKSLRIQVVFGALDKLTGPLKSISERATIAKEALKNTRGELKAITDTQKDLDKFRTSKSVDEIARLSKKLEAAGVDVDNLAESERRLKANAERATLSIMDQEKALKKLSDASERSAKFKDFGGKATAMGTGAMAGGAAVLAPIGLATKQAMDLESSMADVKKVLDFTPESVKQLSNDMLDMSTRVPLSVDGLTQIAAAAGRAGVAQDAIRAGKYDQARKELTEFTETAAKMGVAFDISADQAGETMASWRTAFRLSQTEIIQLGDQINALTNAYGGNAAAVTDMVTRIGPLAEVAGVAPDKLAAMAGLLSSIGIQSEVGATGMKNLMLNLTKGTAATKSQQTAFAALGLNAEKVSKSMQVDAEGTILDVLTRISKLSPDKQASTLTQLFGSESVGAIAPMLTGLDQLKKNFAMVGDQSQYAGAMQNEYLARIANSQGAVDLAMNSLKALNIEMGSHMLPTVTKLAEFTSKVSNRFRNWAKENPALSGTLITFTAAGAGLVVALGAIGVGVGALSFAMGALGITTWAALWPILAVIAAAAAIVAVVANWDKISEAAVKIWGKVKEAFSSGVQKIRDWLAGIDWMQLGLNIVTGILNGILGGIPMLVAAFARMATAGLRAFKEKLNIKSPSRVMMQMGGFVTDGLAEGIEAKQDAPVDRMRHLAAGLMGAVTIGAGVTQAVASGTAMMEAAPVRPVSAVAASAGPSPSPMVGKIEIHIYPTPEQDATDISAEIERRLEDFFSRQNRRKGSGYDDSDD